MDAEGSAGYTIRSVNISAVSAMVTTSFIGDRNAAVNNAVTFWDAQWWQDSVLSSGPVPAGFKGFAEMVSTIPPGCGGTWTTQGNSSGPPDSVPAYMAVVASGLIWKSGSAIEGDIEKIVVIRTDPGYSPSPGHRGTGTVVGVLSCS